VRRVSREGETRKGWHFPVVLPRTLKHYMAVLRRWCPDTRKAVGAKVGGREYTQKGRGPEDMEAGGQRRDRSGDGGGGDGSGSGSGGGGGSADV
jgi:hypothetical protein